MRAHDAYEVSAEAKVREDHIDFVITLARSTASYAMGKDEAERRRFEPAEFEKVKPRLIASAQEFFVFRFGDQRLAARTVEANLTAEEDVELRLTYARPAAGKLVVKAQIFSMLPQEPYGSTFFCYGPKGELLAYKFIDASDPFVEAALPAPAAKPAPDNVSGAK